MYKIKRIKSGVTLVELMVVAAISTVIMLAVAGLMADSQRGFNQVYAKTNSDLAQDDYAVRRLFSAVVRKCSTSDTATTLDINGEWVNMQYYNSDSSTSLDRYAKFYKQSDKLILERGVVDPAETLTTQTVCESVDSVKFIRSGSAILMILKLDDQEQTRTINTSAVMQNP